MKPYIVGAIFARGGSKGIPRKNIRLLAGKPLIAYAIETALACPHIDRVIVSTDDEEIAQISRQYGADVPFMRPAELAMDNSPEWLSWQHAIRFLQAERDAPSIDGFISIPPTSPLRVVEDVSQCIETLFSSDADIVVTVKEASRNPYFNMITFDESGYVRLAMSPEKKIIRRQDAPTVYDMTTVAYATRPDYILNTEWIMAGKVKAVIIPAERAVDIDTYMDFKLAELILTTQYKQKG